jgi:crossover junction endodeoxyribonuclease RuvC
LKVSSPLIVGIDPGISGAIAVIDGDSVTFYDTPAKRVMVGAKERSDYDLEEMSRTLDALTDRTVDAAAYFSTDRNGYPKELHIAIELVGSMPTDGHVGAFKFGKGYGAWLMGLVSRGLKYTQVSPLKWKRYFGLLGSDKRGSLEKARELYPQAADRLTRLKDNGRADALLIGRWMLEVKNTGGAPGA